MKVFVTGIAGFLGSHVAEALLKNGHEVVGVDNLIGGDRANVPPGAVLVHGNVVRLAHCREKLRGCELIYHCAALAYEGLSVFSPLTIVDNVVSGSVAVMVEAVNCGAKRVVNCSSMARYGDAMNPPFQEAQVPHPVDPYGMAKLQAEQQMTLIGGIHGVEVVHAVPHNIVGPRQKYDDPYRNVVSIFANRMLQGKPPIVYGNGGQVRCFSHVDDVVPILLKLGTEKVEHGEVFNVGPDEGEVTILELADLVAFAAGVKMDPKHVPGRPQEVKHATCSSDKIRRRFGFEQKVMLREAVRSVVDFVKRKGPKPFVYHLPIEINNQQTPETWTKELM